MAGSFNKVVLVGNITRDIDVKHTPGGTAVCDIGLAVNRSWFDKATNSKKEETAFIDCTAWGRTAEIAGEYLGKGRSVLIEGRLSMDEWTDKTTNQRRTKLKVTVENLVMLGGKSDAQQSSDSPAESFYETPATGAPDTEVPF